MSIRSMMEWDSSSNRMMGFVDLELNSGNNDDSYQLDTEVLVVMAVGLVGHWKTPIAYFLTAKLSSSMQGELIKQSIVQIHLAGLVVVALVCDGLSANVKMVKDFGCSLNPDQLKSFFVNPADPSDLDSFSDRETTRAT